MSDLQEIVTRIEGYQENKYKVIAITADETGVYLVEVSVESSNV